MWQIFMGVLFLCGNAIGSDQDCELQGGTCIEYRYYKCAAGVETSLCDDDSKGCCLECDSTCSANEDNWATCCDSACTSTGGVCQDNSNFCSGSYSSGTCGGPSSRQCCGPSNCTLKTYSSANVQGYNGLTIQVDDGFVSSMNAINGYAQDCGITVWILRAFREEQQNLDGTVAPPTTTSNHVVGHAMDMNVDTPEGWCNWDCLYAGYNSYAECFVQKIINDEVLVWVPSDPVHIDDDLNAQDYSEWEDLYYKHQAACG